MKTSEILIEAKKKINTPEKWTAGTLARDEAGCAVAFGSESAVCFCSMGALEVEFCEKDIPRLYWFPCINALNNSIPVGGGIAIFNDTHTHKEVMEVWDRAIAEAKAEGK